MKQDDCIMCQTVDDLAPSKSYCPDHKYTNEGKSMKQDDVREDWEREFDFLTWNWIIFSEPNGDKNYGFNVLKDFIRQEIDTAKAEEREKTIEEVKQKLKGLDCGLCNYEKEVVERLDALSKKGTK